LDVWNAASPEYLTTADCTAPDLPGLRRLERCPEGLSPAFFIVFHFSPVFV
jgi:hypothetical protein